jgi:hypothetical protein
MIIEGSFTATLGNIPYETVNNSIHASHFGAMNMTEVQDMPKND